jgi:signal peptidase II
MKKFSITQISFVIIGILILDQLTKLVTKSSMQIGENIPVIGNFFRFTYVENPGMAFGIRVDNSVLFMILSLFAAGLVFYYLFKLRNEAWPLQLAISMIAAGAIGNLADRLIRGSVVDFLDFEFFDVAIPAFQFLGINFTGYSMTRWPVFNIADMAVSSGMIIIFAFILFKGDPLEPSLKEESTQTTTHAG